MAGLVRCGSKLVCVCVCPLGLLGAGSSFVLLFPSTPPGTPAAAPARVGPVGPDAGRL